MREVTYTREALENIRAQLTFLKNKGAVVPALSLRAKIEQFTHNILTYHPHIGHYIPEDEIYEAWIPRTHFVVWYRFDATHLEIIALRHTAQNRREAA